MSIIRLPGLIDVHVHLRDPGQTYKEDFYSGSAAALAGGFTTILDMPNNKIAVTSYKELTKKISIAKKKIVCDVGFHFGSLGDNIEEFGKVRNHVFGLKLYLNMTTGNYLINKEKIPLVFKNWYRDKPILLHSEGDLIEEMIEYAKFYKRKIHVCHISQKKELQAIIRGKRKKVKVSCGVTPHHMFLTSRSEKKIDSLARMKPPLASQSDIDFLWDNLNFIDVIESDHAPHTMAEKKSNSPPFGVPGLETTLPLLLTADSKKRISIERIIEMCYKNPMKIFHISRQKNTYIEVDTDIEYEIKGSSLFTKSKWTPFEGWKVRGKVKKVVLRGRSIFEDTRVKVGIGFGNIVTPDDK